MDVVLNKKESIERCVKQIRFYYSRPSDAPFEEDYMKQDAIAINLQRAAEQVIDLANHVIRKKRLGLPKESKESFEILASEHIVTHELADRLKRMVGFRNVLVHEYQEFDVRVMKDVIEHRLDDLIAFTNCVMDYMKQQKSN